MKTLITVIGLLAVAAGIFGLIAPDLLLEAGRDVLTPTGLYVVAALRVCIGLLLIVASKSSRMPRIVRILGGLIVIAGILTPLFGVDRSVAVLNWYASQGPTIVRLVAVIPVVAGAFMIYVIGSPRRQAA